MPVSSRLPVYSCGLGCQVVSDNLLRSDGKDVTLIDKPKKDAEFGTDVADEQHVIKHLIDPAILPRLSYQSAAT